MKFWDDILELNTLLIALGIGSIGTLTTRSLNSLKNYKLEDKKSREKTEARFELLEETNRAILHDKIYKYCNEALKAGWVSISDLENLDRLFKSYKNLGGNGSGEAIYNKVKDLPTQKPEGVKE